MQNVIDQYQPLIRADFASSVEIQTLPTEFEDATHQLFKVTDANNNHYCYKCCDFSVSQKSYFWRGIDHLFEVSLKHQIEKAPLLYALVAESSPLKIPELVSIKLHFDQACLKTSWLKGINLETPSAHEVELIAKHLAQCHQIPTEKDNHWQTKVVSYIQRAVKIPTLAKPELLAKAETLNESEFGLIMPDLRWDQFMRLETGQLAFTDLDALVSGPIRLDLVILEYLLTSQAEKDAFRQTYENFSTMQSIKDVREVYRAMLFEMNILGEQNFQKWITHPVLFD